MKRYCANCQKEFEFNIRSAKDLENLTCPECGAVIDKNSRKPVNQKEAESAANAIGNAFGILAYIGYIFYFVAAFAGIYSYIKGWDSVLYVLALLVTVVYFFQYRNSEWGIIWYALFGGAGYIMGHGLRGSCLGIMIFLIVRHLLRRVFISLIMKLVSASKNAP